jgi:hypothetical protein
MAYFVAGVVALLPMLSLTQDEAIFAGTPVAHVADVLWVPTLVFGVGFLWMFPDGRFRGVYVLSAAFTASAAYFTWLLGYGNLSYAIYFMGMILLVIGGLLTQVWRHHYAPLTTRRLGRRNLAVLVSLPCWTFFWPWLYERFERGGSPTSSDDGRLAVFAFHQLHLTIYFAFPVVAGFWVLYLMRNQGWWDAQRFWSRAAVFGILTPVFVGAYVAVLVAVTVVAEGVSGDAARPFAVLAATAIVAFVFRPAQRAVARWVDGRFFPSRLQADRAVARFTDRIRHEADAVAVRSELLAVVSQTLTPQHARLWDVGPGVRP